jgi:hypothetical protein
MELQSPVSQDAVKTLTPVASTFFMKLKQWKIVRAIYLTVIILVRRKEAVNNPEGLSTDR